MLPSAQANFDSIALGKQILDLHDQVYREVRARRYGQAAALRDQREALERRLKEFGNPTVARNVGIKMLQVTPGLSLLEDEESTVNASFLQLVTGAPLPPRWVLSGYSGSCRASIAKLLDVDALDSLYFQTRLPVLNSRTLASAVKPMEWLAAAIQIAAREPPPTVWIVTEPAYLAERGLLDAVLGMLRTPSTNFVACLLETDAPFSSRFAEICGVTTMSA